MPTLLLGILIFQLFPYASPIDLNDLEVIIGDEDGFGSQGELWRTCEEVPCTRNFVCVMRKLTCLTEECSNISPLPLCVPGDPLNNCAFINCADGYKCIHVEENCESSPCLPKPACIANKALTDHVEIRESMTTSFPSLIGNEKAADSPIHHLHIPMPPAGSVTRVPTTSVLPPRTQINQFKGRTSQRQLRTIKSEFISSTNKTPDFGSPKPPSPPEEMKKKMFIPRNATSVPSGSRRVVTLGNMTVTKDIIISRNNHLQPENSSHGRKDTHVVFTPSNRTSSINLLSSHLKPPKDSPITNKLPTRHQPKEKLLHHLEESHNDSKDFNRFTLQHLQRSKSFFRVSNPQKSSLPLNKRDGSRVTNEKVDHQQVKNSQTEINRLSRNKGRILNSRAVSFIFLDADPQLIRAVGDFAYRNHNAHRRGNALSRQNNYPDPCRSVKCSENQRCEAISATAAMCAQIPQSRNAQLQQVSSPWALQPPSATSKSLNDFVQGAVKSVQDYISQIECVISGKCSKDYETTTTTSRPKNPQTVRDYQYTTRHPCDSIYCIHGFCRITNGQARCVPDYMTIPTQPPVIVTTPRRPVIVTTAIPQRPTVTTQRPTTTTTLRTTTTTLPSMPVCGNFEEPKPCGKNCETTCTDGKLECIPQCGSHECVCMEGFHRYAGFCVRPAICPVNPFAVGK